MTTGLRRRPRAVALAAALASVTIAGCSDPVDRRSVNYTPAAPGTVVSSSNAAYLDPAAAEQLSAELAAATAGTDWCLGWSVAFDGGTDEGSNLGPDLTASTCPNWVVVAADIDWTSESSELNDSAGIDVFSSDADVEAQLRANDEILRGASPAAVAGDDGDTVVANAVSAVALALAADGILTDLSVSVTEDPSGVTFEDAGGEGGNDAFALRPSQLLVGGGLILGGLVLILLRFVLPRRAKGRSTPAATGTPLPAGSRNPRAALRAALAAQQTAAPPVPGPGPATGAATPPPPPPPPPTAGGTP